MHFDAHVHSAASPDSQLDPQLAINILKQKGLGIAFTEHVDFITPTQGKDMTATDTPQGQRDFICDFDIYPSQYNQYRGKSVLLGLEVGLSQAYLPLNNQVANGDYDFILGSIHFVEGMDVYHDAAKEDAADFCRRYLTYGKKMVEKSGFFDSLAHIDYPARYSESLAKALRYELFPEEFDGLLSALVDRDIAMEINTSRFGDNNVVGQLLPIYKRFYSLGGRYVTIGSDAHGDWGLGRHHAKALGLASMAGLTPVFYYGRNRFEC